MSSPVVRRLWRVCRIALAGQEGLEPPTTGFGDRDSGQLSYCPVLPTQCHTPRQRAPAATHGHAAATTARLPVHAVYVRTARPSNRLARGVWGGRPPEEIPRGVLSADGR